MMYKEILFTKEAHALQHPDAIMRLLRPGLSKQASADEAYDSPLHPLVQEYIEYIEPDDSSTWVLVNALGAGEWYGQNINGDFFPYKELVTHTEDWLGLPVTDRAARHAGSRQIVTGYPSFYDAHVYKHHVNKDPSKSFGDIMAAIWNERMKRVELVIRIDHQKAEKWLASEVVHRIHDGDFPDVSMGCFRSKSAKILTKDLTETPIGEIQQGDVVLTHRGRWSTVTEIFSQPHKGPTYNIHSYGWRDPLELTGEHPLWLMKKECVQCSPSSKSINSGYKQKVCADSLRSQKKECSGCTTRPKYVFGWVRADEASIGDYLATPVLVGERDLDLPDHHVELIGHYLAEGYTSIDKKGNKLVHFCLDLDEETKGGHIQNLLAETPSTRWISSHVAPAKSGLYISAKSDYLHQLFSQHAGSSAKNKKLSADLCRLNRRQQKILLGAYADGGGGKYRGALYFSTASEDLAKQLQMVLLRHRMIASINTIAPRPFEKSVAHVDTIEYQVWVGSDTSYLLNSSTHRLDLGAGSKGVNSKRFFIKHDGVEYLASPIIAIDEEEYDDYVYNFSVAGDDSYVAEGLAVHNCKVPFDVCSICGNKAKTKQEYCIHINERRTVRDPRGDGQRPYMINIKPRFFDLSFVFIGADKTARVLKKLAGAEVEKAAYVVPGLLGKVATKAVGSPPLEKKKPNVDEQSLQRLLYKAASLQKEGKQLKLADIIKYVVPNKDAARVSKIMGGEPDLPEEAQDELARKGIEGAAEETARGGMVLKPHEFMRIALVGSGLKGLADQLRGKTPFPSNDVELPMHPCPMHGSSGGPTRALKQLFMGRSITPPMIVKREVRITMMSPISQPGKLQEAKSPLLDKISAAYNGYRLWLLANQSELGLNKEASAPSLAVGFGSRVFEERTGDPELTEAYLLAAHWQAGGR